MERPNFRFMLKGKLNWKRPVFYLLLPIFLVMIFKRRRDLIVAGEARDDAEKS
jgi:cytochrome c-type biogenesis protein CcmH/NrfF